MIVFAAAFIFSLVLLITAKNGSKRWLVLFISLVTEIAASAVLMKVFDALPGYGMMPGLTYLGEWMVCVLFLAVYLLLAAISVIVKIISAVKKK